MPACLRRNYQHENVVAIGMRYSTSRLSAQSSSLILSGEALLSPEDRCQVSVFGTREIELLLSFLEPIVKINVVLGNVDSA
jgi:hypothetical protein